MLKNLITVGLFSVALLSFQTASSAEAKATPSGVAGMVSLSPGCPGPQRKDQDCTKPVVGKDVELLDRKGKLIGKATTGDDGKFTINAKHGKYMLKVNVEAMYPKCPNLDVTIKRHAMTDANISCDSGMR